MRIDAVSGGNSHYDNQNSLTRQEIKIRNEYNNLLTNFRNTPNKSSGDKGAIESLQVFEDKKGTPPSMPEEFLGDVKGWINF